MQSIIEEHRSEFERVIDHFKAELNGLRTGRANTAMVEDIPVEAYGSVMSVKGVASVQVPDSKTILVEPWDKAMLKEIEKAIRSAPIGVNPVVDGNRVRVTLPALTEDSRKELVKIIGKKAEEARIGIRGVREAAKDQVAQAEKDKEITEDERFRLQEALDLTTKSYNEQVSEISKEKEEEIMTI